MFTWLKKLFNASPESPLSTPSQWLTDIFGTSTYAGPAVNETTAMQSSAVYACVSLLSQTVACLPLLVMRKKGDHREPAPQHPLYFMIHEQPNENMPTNVWLELMMCHVLLGGNAYSVIGKSQGNQIIDLNPITNPRGVTPERVNGQVQYKVQLADGGTTIIPDDDMFHLPGLGFDGLSGFSPVGFAARQAIGLALATEEHGSRLFSNSTRLSGVLKHPKTLKEDSANRLAAAWNGLYGGAANSGKTAILEDGMEFQPMSMTAEDAQFLETRRFQVEDISRFFRVPLHMINETSKSTSWGSGLEQLSLGFVQYTLTPWLVRIEQEINRKLLRKSVNKPSPFFAKFKLEGLLRGDSTARAALYASGHQNTWLTPNEIRELEDRPPVDGGDKLYVQVNLKDINEPTPEADPMTFTTDEQEAPNEQET